MSKPIQIISRNQKKILLNTNFPIYVEDANRKAQHVKGHGTQFFKDSLTGFF